MIVKIDDLNIYLEKSGRKGRPIILLHGWGQNTQMMAFIAEFLKKHFVVYNLDLPGFGQSDEPKTAWGVLDYTDFLYHFCEKYKIDNPIIIAHSFGCRIAVRFAYKYKADKLVLTGAAGVKDKHSIAWYFKTYTYKLAKQLFPEAAKSYSQKVGSDDYKNTSGIMRQTFVKVVNDDIKPILKDIRNETLLVFGSKDDATPLEKGELMEQLMQNATLIVFEGDDHFAYINQAVRFNAVLDAFLKEDYNG